MNIAIISSSIREGRTTRRVALHLLDQLKKMEKLQTELIDLTDYEYPIWKEVFHREVNPPEECVILHDKLAVADAMIFVTPEYNGSYSLALKNMVDYFGLKVFEKKAIGISSVSTGYMGGIRSALQLQQLILAIYAHPAPQLLLIPSVLDFFGEEGNLLDEPFGNKVDLFLREFIWLSEALFAKRSHWVVTK